MLSHEILERELSKTTFISESIYSLSNNKRKFCIQIKFEVTYFYKVAQHLDN